MEKVLQIAEDLSTFTNELIAGGEMSVEVSDNAVRVENKSQSDLGNVYKNIGVDSLDIFEFEVEFDLLTSSEDGGLGLILGWDGKVRNGSLDNYLRLLIEPNGKFSIDYFYDKHKELVAIEHSEFINQGIASNKITVQKNGSEIHFFANAGLIFTLQGVALAGTKFGLILGPLTAISINSLYFASPETTESTDSEERNELQGEEEDIHGTGIDDHDEGYPLPPVRKRSKFRIFVITLLLVAWAFGFLVYREPGYVHILLVAAVLLLIIRRKR